MTVPFGPRVTVTERFGDATRTRLALPTRRDFETYLDFGTYLEARFGLPTRARRAGLRVVLETRRNLRRGGAGFMYQSNALSSFKVGVYRLCQKRRTGESAA